MLAFLIICVLKDCLTAIFQVYEYGHNNESKGASFVSMIIHVVLVVWGINLISDLL